MIQHKKSPYSVIFAIVSLIFIAGPSYSEEEAGLLIIAHGSKNPAWQEKVLQLGEIIKKNLREQKEKHFIASSVSFLEMTKPDISDAVNYLQNNGVKKIIAIPLFICTSEHTSSDIPVVLGINYDNKKREELSKEGIKLVRASSRIQIGKPLGETPILERRVLEIVRSVSQNPKEERILLLAHGSDEYRKNWDQLMNSLSNAINKEAGINEIDWAYIKMGQKFSEEAIPLIEKQSDKKLIIIGLYLATSAEDIRQKQKYNQPKDIIAVWTNKSILHENDEDMANWLMNEAQKLL